MITAEPRLHVIQYSLDNLDPDSRRIVVSRVIGWLPRDEYGVSEPLLVRAIHCLWHVGDASPMDWVFGSYDTGAKIEDSDIYAGETTIYFTPENGSMRALITAVNETLPYIGKGITPVAIK